MNECLVKAIVIGEQSLLIQCCEVLLEQGISLSAIVSCNPQIIRWCEGAGLRYLTCFEELKGEFSENSQDYLFSITNLRLLPHEILSIARCAINFHDGPLPSYAGLNAPVWALLNNEAEHGVTWHEITSEVDSGRVLIQQKFNIVPGETALSINTKCYQAGLESFSDLVSSLVNHRLSPIEQDLSQRSYFELTRRPDAAGLIDWCASAEVVERLVRAMDYGAYRNPLVCPKMFLGDELFIVTKARIESRAAGQVSGQIVDIDSTSLSIGCADGVIELSGLKSLKAQPVGCVVALMREKNIKIGDQLPSLSEAARARLTRRVQESCRFEAKWVEALLNAEALAIPYASADPKGCSSDKVWQAVPVFLPDHATTSEAFQESPQVFAVSLFAVMLARLSSKSQFTLATLQVREEELEAFFEPCLPLTVDLDVSKGFEKAQSNIQQSLTQFEQWGVLASDIWGREPVLANNGDLAKFPIKLDLHGVFDQDVLQHASHTGLVLSISQSGDVTLYVNLTKVSLSVVEKLVALVNVIATEVSAHPQMPLAELMILSEQDRACFERWNDTQAVYDKSVSIHRLIEQQAEVTPKAIALAFEDKTLDYQSLNASANQLATLLIAQSVKPGDLIGVMMDRSIDMVVALVAIHKAGCAYVPLDPGYPADRLKYMIEDSSLALLLTETSHQSKLGSLAVKVLVREEYDTELSSLSDGNLDIEQSSDCLAYVIYTSGSTGKPKGVMVEHRNVVNFFAGMDRCIEKLSSQNQGVWLAVTSISFDISVLEIFWTLARGFKVVLYSEQSALSQIEKKSFASLNAGMDFSLFYWNVADEASHHQPNKYELLLEGAKFADRNGFKAVWNPERHFASFGGLFPNPSVTLAALSTITKHVDLRAGSCVAPLHSPIRIAEEWAVVDNLSNGRVGIAVASGWAPPDFAIKPENFAQAKSIMFESLDKVRRLWRGETVIFPGPTGDVEVKTLPRPIQKELPYWVTTAGNVDTFRQAGESGANILTHLLGQTIGEVKEKVDAYREAWAAAGHRGQGTITLMLHTLIGESLDQVEGIVRQPMKDYLKSAMFLVKGAAWTFPTFKKMSEETGKSLDEFFETISDDDMDDLLEFAFQRYFRTSGLFGTPESAMETVAKCAEIGVNEIACLIDFGVDTQVVMQQLPYLNALRQKCSRGFDSDPSSQVDASDVAGRYSIADLIRRHQVTHFQCTPSMATMLVSDPQSKKSLHTIEHMMVGGEAISAPLAESLLDAGIRRLTNMYGPTETTIWSTTADIQKGQPISIGKAISNTQIYIVDQQLNALPAGVPGELVIGGDGVVRGYFNRPELTKDRFVDGWKPDREAVQQRIYRTGDLAFYTPEGLLICLGRIDHQVKLRGYRIELGEIEAHLHAHETVKECAVILREDQAGDGRLVAYVRPQFETPVNAEELKEYLSEKLPEFMVPAFYVELAAMPLTPNGKLDRKALPAPIQQKHQNSGEFSLPEDDWENLVADIWKSALGVSEVGRKDNFFDIGGHSLLVIQVLKELRQHENVAKPLQMTDLFRYTTVEALAKFISTESSGVDREAGNSRVAARKAAMARRRRR